MGLNRVDSVFRSYSGIGLWPAVLVVAVLSGAGLLVGFLFPKYEATAFLQFPEIQKRPEQIPGRPAQTGGVEQRLMDPKANVIELAAFKRVAASYDSAAQLASYLNASGLATSAGASRLLTQADDPGFWSRAAVPILPFSRRDQKEFGDIKDAAATALLGLELTADARTEGIAQEMITVLAGYYTNAVMRERIRAWVMAGKVDAQSQQKTLQADILRAELDIQLYGRRAEDMKAVLARYPGASRMDARQVVSINPAEGGERYLSPLAQLVGAESATSQRRELISRWQRESKQKQMLSTFFAGAETTVDQESDVARLLPALRELSSKTFAAEATQEWNREAALRVDGALDGFEVMRSQFGVRSSARVGAVPGRTPLRLGGLAAGFGLLLLGMLAFLRASLPAIRGEAPSGMLAGHQDQTPSG